MSEYPQYGPDNVDVRKCREDEENNVHEHHCIHDWRIHWGNVPRKVGLR